jgi:hypothetical protein
MEVKGTAIKTIPEFVKVKFPHEYNLWIESLPKESRAIMENRISMTNWYPLDSALIIPTQSIGEMFFKDIQKGAYELGVFSSVQAIKGIYKMLVMVSSPSFIVNRASIIMSGYYRPCMMDITKRSKDMAVLSIVDFPAPNVVVDYRILGWIKNTMEFSKFRNPKVEMLKSMGKGDTTTDYLVQWVE